MSGARVQFSAVVNAYEGRPHKREWRSLRHGGIPKMTGNIGSANHALTYWTGELIGGDRVSAVEWLLRFYSAQLRYHRFGEGAGYSQTHHADAAMQVGELRSLKDPTERELILLAALDEWWEIEARWLALFAVGPSWEIERVGGRAYPVIDPDPDGDGIRDYYNFFADTAALRLLCGQPVKWGRKLWERDGSQGAQTLRDLRYRVPYADAIAGWVERAEWSPLLVHKLRVFDRIEVRRWRDRCIAWLPDGCRTYQANGQWPILISDSPTGYGTFWAPSATVEERDGRLWVNGSWRLELPAEPPLVSLSYDGSKWSRP